LKQNATKRGEGGELRGTDVRRAVQKKGLRKSPSTAGRGSNYRSPEEEGPKSLKKDDFSMGENGRRHLRGAGTDEVQITKTRTGKRAAG